MHARTPRAPLAAGRQHPRDADGARSIIDFGFGDGIGRAAAAGHRPGGAAGRRSPPSSAPSPRWRPPRARSDPTSSRTAAPYLQPLALSAATRKQASKALLQRAARRDRDRHRRGAGAARAAGARARPARSFMIAALSAAFYVLLPQLADVGDSVDALGSANWWWLGGVRRHVARYLRRRRHRPGRRRARAPAVRPEPRGADGVVVRQPGHAGQRRRDGAQRAVPAEGGRRARRGRDRHRPERGRRRHRARRAADPVRGVGRQGRRQRRSRSRRAASCW